MVTVVIDSRAFSFSSWPLVKINYEDIDVNAVHIVIVIHFAKLKLWTTIGI